MTRLLMCGLVFSAASIALYAQDSKPTSRSDYAAEFKELTAQFKAATDAFYKPYNDAKTDEEREKVQLDYDKYPAGAFAPKFSALAARAHGTDAGLDAALWVLQNDQSDKPERKTAVAEMVDDLVATYLQSPALERVASMMRFLSWQMPDGKAEEALRKIVTGTPHAEVKAAAMFTLAGEIGGRKGTKKDEAKKLYESLLKDYAATKYAKQATAQIFELDHLQIGMVAPDFTASDQDGKDWKLADYRGKVTVIDFWGFW